MHSHITIKGDGMRTHIDNTTDYCGNAIYRGDTLSMLLTEEGYVTFATRAVRWSRETTITRAAPNIKIMKKVLPNF